MKPSGIHPHLHQPLTVPLLRLDPQLSGSGSGLLSPCVTHFAFCDSACTVSSLYSHLGLIGSDLSTVIPADQPTVQRFST